MPTNNSWYNFSSIPLSKILLQESEQPKLSADNLSRKRNKTSDRNIQKIELERMIEDVNAHMRFQPLWIICVWRKKKCERIKQNRCFSQVFFYWAMKGLIDPTLAPLFFLQLWFFLHSQFRLSTDSPMRNLPLRSKGWLLIRCIVTIMMYMPLISGVIYSLS